MVEQIPTTRDGIIADALKLVKAANANRYAADQYGVDTLVPDDVIEAILRTSALPDEVVMLRKLNVEQGRHIGRYLNGDIGAEVDS